MSSDYEKITVEFADAISALVEADRRGENLAPHSKIISNIVVRMEAEAYKRGAEAQKQATIDSLRKLV